MVSRVPGKKSGLPTMVGCVPEKNRDFRQWLVVSRKKIEPSENGWLCPGKKSSLPTMVSRVPGKKSGLPTMIGCIPEKNRAFRQWNCHEIT
jgi:hypothetical protein